MDDGDDAVADEAAGALVAGAAEPDCDVVPAVVVAGTVDAIAKEDPAAVDWADRGRVLQLVSVTAMTMTAAIDGNRVRYGIT